MNLLAMQKLLYILQTSQCPDNLLLHELTGYLKPGLRAFLTFSFPTNNGKQASLPVHMEGLEVRSACILASSAFLAAAAILPLQEANLSASLAGIDDSAVNNIKTAWTSKLTQANLRMLSNTSNVHGLSDEAIRVATGYPLATTICHIPASVGQYLIPEPFMAWCVIRAYLSMFTIRSSTTLYGELSRKRRHQRTKSPSECHEQMGNVRIE